MFRNLEIVLGSSFGSCWVVLFDALVSLDCVGFCRWVKFERSEVVSLCVSLFHVAPVVASWFGLFHVAAVVLTYVGCSKLFQFFSCR